MSGSSINLDIHNIRGSSSEHTGKKKTHFLLTIKHKLLVSLFVFLKGKLESLKLDSDHGIPFLNGSLRMPVT